MKKSITLFTLFLCFLLIGFSSALTIEKSAINDVIIKEYNTQAKFLITPFGDSGSYRLYTYGDVQLIPEYVNLTSGKSFELTVIPFERLNTNGFYSFYYNFRNRVTLEDTQTILTIKLVNLQDALDITADSIGLDSETVTIHLNNKENAEIPDAKIKISSILFNSEEKTMDLKPGSNDISINLDFNRLKTISAGSYSIIFDFDGIIKNASLSANVMFTEKKRLETLDESSGLIFRTRSITKKNIGNVPEVAEITVSKNIITRLVTKYSIAPNFVERSGLTVKYRWVEKLDPQATLAVQVKTNYSFILILIILGVLLIYWYNGKYSYKTVEVKKSVHHIKTKGGEFALKVTINVKANKAVEDVVLTDTVPSIVKLYENFPTKPTRIDSKTRKVHWNMGSLGRREQRTVSYVIYSKVGVIGKFSLPEANLVYKIDQQHKYMPSNKVFFLSDQITREED